MVGAIHMELAEFDYRCVFTHRYGRREMRQVWSEERKRLLWREIWTELARSQADLGLITRAQAEDIEAHRHRLDMVRSLEIEEQTRHDLLSEARCLAETCTVGGGVVHLGATSADIEDNADALRVRSALEILAGGMKALLNAFALKVDALSGVATMGYTHLQAAEPTTVGYRMAQYLYDLHDDYHQLLQLIPAVKGKGMKGAVGTSASYIALFMAQGMPHAEAVRLHARMEAQVMQALGLEAHPVSTQIYTRKQDVRVANVLASIAASIYKFCQDLRLLQSSAMSEWYEPRGAQQVGSSAMPFKRNPTTSENVDGICRIAMAFPAIFLNNAAHTILERTLDDSPGRAFGLPTLFIAVDDAITKCEAIVTGLEVNQAAIDGNNRKYHAITITEKLLLVCVTKGANRQHLHEHLRGLCFSLFDAQSRNSQDIQSLVRSDKLIAAYLSPAEIEEIFASHGYIGNCEERCQAMTALVRQSLNRT